MIDGFEIVYRAAGLTEAELIKGYLESAEIPVDLDYESAGQVIGGFTMDGLGEVRVCVPTDYAEDAREALSLRPQIPGSPPDPEEPEAA